MTITGNEVVVAGQTDGATFDWLVRTLDLADGSVDWQNTYDQSGGSDAALAVTAAGHSAYVVGFTQESGTGAPGMHADCLIRAYSR